MYSLFLILSLVGEPNVDALIEQLGDDDYSRRESASAQLAPLTETILAQLKAGRQSPDYEIRWRTEKLIRDYYASVIPSKSEKWPWIDCLPKDYPDRDKILKPIYQKFKDSIGQDVEIDSTKDTEDILREATRQLTSELLEKNKTKKEIVELLDTMVKNEKTISGIYKDPTVDEQASYTYQYQPRRWRIEQADPATLRFGLIWYLRPINPEDFTKSK